MFAVEGCWGSDSDVEAGMGTVVGDRQWGGAGDGDRRSGSGWRWR